MSFAYRPPLELWSSWFTAWRHLTTVVFVCEYFPQWATNNERIGLPIAAQQYKDGVEHSSLIRFKIWSGVDTGLTGWTFPTIFDPFDARPPPWIDGCYIHSFQQREPLQGMGGTNGRAGTMCRTSGDKCL